jgi:hypothetical protein
MPDLKRTLLIDTEGSSTSVRHLIKPDDMGSVILRECEALADVEKVYWEVHRGEIECDVVVIDTLDALATTNRHQYVRIESGVPSTTTVGAIDKIWGKQLDGRRMWQRASDPLIMLCRQFRSLSAGPNGKLTIFLMHEKKAEDEADKTIKGGPGANPMLLSDVMAFSDDVFRIRALVRPTAINGKNYQKGDRVLRMATSEDLRTKIRIGRWIKYDDDLVDPDLFKIQTIMQEFFPRRLCVFGPWGAGKTSLACSFSDPEILKHQPTS